MSKLKEVEQISKAPMIVLTQAKSLENYINGSIVNSDKISLDNEFIKELIFDDEMVNANMIVHRIIFHIGFLLKKDQIYIGKNIINEEIKVNQMKLQLFDEEFLTYDNTHFVFTMQNAKVNENRSYTKLKAALEFLTNYKRGWYNSKNSKGEDISCYGGLISDSVINKNAGTFQFKISAYWLKKILCLNEYNQTLYQLVYSISSNKHMLFWYWLNTLKKEGTNIDFKTLNQRYNLKYKDARSLCKGFLKPIKKSFDVLSLESFNYSIRGNILSIKRYPRSIEDIAKTIDLSSNSKSIVKKDYKLSYFKKRHNLSNIQISELKLVMTNIKGFDLVILFDAYSEFVKDCRKNKILSTDFIGQKFLEEWQKHIILVYRKTQSGLRYPNSYPKIF